MSLIASLITEEEFDALQEEWNQLLGQSRGDSVFLRWEWIHTWWTIYKEGRQLYILTVRSNSHLIGVAPFYIDQAGQGRTRYLKLCSDELGPDYLDLIAEKGREKEVTEAVLGVLKKSPTLWDVIAFDNLRIDSILLSNPSTSMKYRSTTQSSHTCPYISIQGTFDNYLQSHPELDCFSLEKKQNKLFHARGVTHHIVQEGDDLLKRFDHLFLLHEKRAGEKRLQTNFISDSVKRFHRELGRLFLKNNILNLQFLYEGGTPLCAHYLFNYRHKTYYFQSGFDPAWSKLSVSMVLLRMNIQQAFESGMSEFDFLKGNERYKTLWANAIHQEKCLTAYNKSPLGYYSMAVDHLRRAGRNIKKLLNDRPMIAGPVSTGSLPSPREVPQN